MNKEDEICYCNCERCMTNVKNPSIPSPYGYENICYFDCCGKCYCGDG